MNGLNRSSNSTDTPDNVLSGPTVYSPDIQEKIQYLRSQGAGDKVPAWLKKQGLDPELYTNDPEAFGAGPGAENPILRALGLTGRAISSGVESSLRSPFNAGQQAVRSFGNYFVPTAGDAMARMTPGAGPNRVADLMGFPTPQTPAESTAVNVGQDAAAAVPFAIGTGPLGFASTVASSVAGGIAQREAASRGAGEGGQIVAGLVAGLATPAIISGGAETIRRVLAGAQAQRQAAQNAQTVLAAATGQAAVSLGQVAERGIARNVESGLRGSRLGTAGPFRRTIAAQEQGLQGSANRFVDNLAPLDQANPEAVGEMVQRGIEGPRSGGVLGNQQMLDDIIANAGPGPATPIIRRPRIAEGYIPRFWEESRRLYDNAFNVVPAETPVIPTNAIAWFDRQGNNAQSAIIPSLANPALQGWGNEFRASMLANPNGVPFQELKRLRSLIDDQIQSFDPAAAATQGTRMKDLVGLRSALSDDLGATIVQRGGRPGAQAWQDAQAHFIDGMDNIENVFQPLVSKRTPEQVFNALMSGTKQGATIARTALRELEPAQRPIVLSSMFRRLMQGPAGQADVRTLATNWRKFTPDARAAMTHHLGVAATNDLNNVFRAVEVLDQAAANMPSPALSGSGSLFKKIIGGVTTGGPALAMSGVIPAQAGLMAGATAGATSAGLHLASQMFTSPRVVRWLLGTTRLPVGVLPAQLTQLAKQAQKWSAEDRAIAQSLVSQLQPPGMPDPFVAMKMESPGDATVVR